MKRLTNKTVVVGMSGGVDSSVTALLMKQQGAHVIGLFMRNWEEDEKCLAELDYHDVVAVAGALDIPFYTVNFAKEYWDNVFAVCLKQFKQGLTPNPDILCNREIKFHLFLEKALQLGADYLATGHYCQKENRDGVWRLLRGADPGKDQSYFLHTLKSEQLEKVLFPIGHLQKSRVREIAEESGFVTAKKKDSTGICFVGKRDFKEFLAKFLPKKKGEFKTPDGKVVGIHEGAHFFTVGQRRGIGIGGEGSAWFVVGKEMESNTVIVVQGEDHPALYQSCLFAKEVSWVVKEPRFPCNCTAKIRYRSADVACSVIKRGVNGVEVLFDEPQKAVTQGQSIVFYQDNVCLGGGVIRARKEINWLSGPRESPAVERS